MDQNKSHNIESIQIIDKGVEDKNYSFYGDVKPELNSYTLIVCNSLEEHGIYGSLPEYGSDYKAYLPIRDYPRGKKKRKEFIKNLKSNKNRFVAQIISVNEVNKDSYKYDVEISCRDISEEDKVETYKKIKQGEQISRLVDKAAIDSCYDLKTAHEITIYNLYSNYKSEESEEDTRDLVADTILLKFPEYNLNLILHELKLDSKDEKRNKFIESLLKFCKKYSEDNDKTSPIIEKLSIGSFKDIGANLNNNLDNLIHIENIKQSITDTIDNALIPKECTDMTIIVTGADTYELKVFAKKRNKKIAINYLEDISKRITEKWSTIQFSPPTIFQSLDSEESSIPFINIGVIGEVAHGKSTLVKMLTGKRTQSHSKENTSHGITINLGFANANIYYCEKCEIYDCNSGELFSNSVTCICGNQMVIKHRVSFVDCPGHAEYMTNMLSGTSTFDAVLLIAASNSECPSNQALEHLNALEYSKKFNEKNVAVIQTKCELVNEKKLKEHYISSKDGIKNTIAKNSPFIPTCSLRNIGKNDIAEWISSLNFSQKYSHIPKINFGNNIPKWYALLDDSVKNNLYSIIKKSIGYYSGLTSEAISEIISDFETINETQVREIYKLFYSLGPKKMQIIRSWDINSPGKDYKEQRGGAFGGTITGIGIFTIGENIEIRPGIINGNICIPLKTSITSFGRGKTTVDMGDSGGLISFCTTLNPGLCASNFLVGNVVGAEGTLPPVFSKLYLYNLLTNEKLRANDIISVHIGSASSKAKIERVKTSHKKMEVVLLKPICSELNSIVALMHESKFIGNARIYGGSHVNIHNDTNSELDLYIDELDEVSLENSNLVDDYNNDQTIIEDNVRFRNFIDNNISVESSKKIIIIPPKILKHGVKNQICSNFKLISESLNRNENHMINFLEKEYGFKSKMLGDNQSLKIDCRGKLITKTFENFLKKYIINYVLCTQCNNLKTEINRKDKSYEIKCLNCNAFRYVS